MAGLAARLVGAALIVAGFALWSIPVAFIAAGIVCLIAGNEADK